MALCHGLAKDIKHGRPYAEGAVHGEPCTYGYIVGELEAYALDIVRKSVGIFTNDGIKGHSVALIYTA